MKKSPVFLICTNEPAAPGRAFVLHTLKPAFLAEVFSFKTAAEAQNFEQLHAQNPENSPFLAPIFTHPKPRNGFFYSFAILYIFSQPATPGIPAATLRRLADWYFFTILTK